MLRPWQLGAGHQGSLWMRFEENREVPVPDGNCVSGANARSTTEKTAQVLNSYFRTITTSKPIGSLPSKSGEDNFCEYAKCLDFSRNPFKFHAFLLASILLSGATPDGVTSVLCGAQSTSPRAPLWCRMVLLNADVLWRLGMARRSRQWRAIALGGDDEPAQSSRWSPVISEGIEASVS